MSYKMNKRDSNGLFISYNAVSSTSSHFFIFVNCYKIISYMTCGKPYYYLYYLLFYLWLCFAGKPLILNNKQYISTSQKQLVSQVGTKTRHNVHPFNLFRTWYCIFVPLTGNYCNIYCFHIPWDKAYYVLHR